MSVRALLDARVGELHLDGLALEVDDGRTLALVGPNGSGKTTALRLLAGLRRLDSGFVELDGRLLDDPATGRFVPPERRGVGYVFQEHLLFPHLSIVENVAFGPRSRGFGRGEARRSAAEWLDRMGLLDRSPDRPAELSGGEAQRVALARALASRPRLLLLDEPMAALDAHTRSAVRRDLAEHLSGFDGAAVLVTHDPLDASSLADDVTVLELGTVTQRGTVGDLAARPATRWVADLLGTNLFTGTVGPTGLVAVLDGGGALVVAEPQPVGSRCTAVVPPQAVSLHLARPEGSARNVWQGSVEVVEQLGARMRVRVNAAPPIWAEVTAEATATLALRPGSPVWVAVKATEVDVLPN